MTWHGSMERLTDTAIGGAAASPAVTLTQPKCAHGGPNGRQMGSRAGRTAPTRYIPWVAAANAALWLHASGLGVSAIRPTAARQLISIFQSGSDGIGVLLRSVGCGSWTLA
jgi:hypothetical protein